jgi:hypothetical protein
MDDRVDGPAAAVLEARHRQVARERIEHLAAVADVRDQRVYARMVQRLEINIEDCVATIEQIRHDVTASLA